MAFWIDCVALFIIGALTPYIFAPTKITEETLKSVKKIRNFLMVLLPAVWYYGAIPLYLNMWRLDIFDNLIIALLLAIPATFAVAMFIYYYLDEPTAFHPFVLGLFFVVFFLTGWLLLGIVTFIGMVLALIMGKGFRSTWYLTWSNKPLPYDVLQKYGQTYFMWNGWLNILGLELVPFDTVKAMIDNPLANIGWHIFAVILFASYPFWYWLGSKLTWNHLYKLKTEET